MTDFNRNNRELETLYRISQAMAHEFDLKQLMHEVLDILETDFGLLRGTLTLLQPGTDLLNIEASHGLSAKEKNRGQYRVGDGITGRVAKTGKFAIIPDITKDPNFLDRTQSRKTQQVAFICVPIIHQNQVIGTMSIDRPVASRGELEHDANYLKLIANLLAESVFRIRTQMEEQKSLIEENRRLRLQIDNLYRPDNMIGNCNNMRRVYEQIAQVADSPATVLIRGESGTGKELVARAIHFISYCKNGPLVSVNCAALPENLIESELFGHEKGAFTGAVQQRKGRFELANGGTLFLDEIGDISPAVQVRLLRALQERTFERVGGNETVKVNVRVIAATNRDLESSMQQGKFRDDLYYRLNVFPIHLPALRERKSDIMLLADSFVKKYSELYNKPVVRISTAAINMMMSYHWPGNVRELENCIERAVLTTTDKVIHGYNLPPSLQTSEGTDTSIFASQGSSLKQLMETHEREIIIDALKKHRGNVAAAARDLHTTKRIMGYALKRLGIDSEKYR
ncbi:Response regulator of zinc sigma-54-dependent two-component system [Chitinispirillum alkaliphilum]|nr:Response regulator of zinc sigma-54-dependent two-component system [Chitinispirillum alkaliphilum]